MNRDTAMGMGIGLLVGALVGAAVGIFYAPRPGKETREMIKEKTGNIIQKARGKVAQFAGKNDEGSEEAAES